MEIKKIITAAYQFTTANWVSRGSDIILFFGADINTECLYQMEPFNRFLMPEQVKILRCVRMAVILSQIQRCDDQKGLKIVNLPSVHRMVLKNSV